MLNVVPELITHAVHDVKIPNVEIYPVRGP